MNLTGGLGFLFFANILVNNKVSGKGRFRIYYVVKDCSYNELEWNKWF